MKRQLVILASIAALAFATWADKQLVSKAFFPCVVSVHGGGSPPPVTSYANAGGTGDRTAICTVTTNIPLTAGTGGTINNLIDGAFANNGTDSINPDSLFAQRTASVMGWIKWDWGAGNERCIDEFKWYQDTGNSNGLWNWAVSNNGDDWLDLTSMATLGSPLATNVYAYSNTGFYRYYAMYKLLAAGDVGSLASTGRWYQEIEFKIVGGGSPTTVPTNVPSWFNKYGHGSRGAFITVTTTATLGGGTAPKLVDDSGDASAAGACWFNAGQTTREVKFALSAARRWVGLRWFQDTTQNHGTWKIAGSNDDSTYTDLLTGQTLGGASMVEYLWTNTNTYLFYKLIQTGGNTSSGPWLLEALAKDCAS